MTDDQRREWFIRHDNVFDSPLSWEDARPDVLALDCISTREESSGAGNCSAQHPSFAGLAAASLGAVPNRQAA
jgi:hypothetical protein